MLYKLQHKLIEPDSQDGLVWGPGDTGGEMKQA